MSRLNSVLFFSDGSTSLARSKRPLTSPNPCGESLAWCYVTFLGSPGALFPGFARQLYGMGARAVRRDFAGVSSCSRGWRASSAVAA